MSQVAGSTDRPGPSRQTDCLSRLWRAGRGAISAARKAAAQGHPETEVRAADRSAVRLSTLIHRTVCREAPFGEEVAAFVV